MGGGGGVPAAVGVDEAVVDGICEGSEGVAGVGGGVMDGHGGEGAGGAGVCDVVVFEGVDAGGVTAA